MKSRLKTRFRCHMRKMGHGLTPESHPKLGLRSMYTTGLWMAWVPLPVNSRHPGLKAKPGYAKLCFAHVLPLRDKVATEPSVAALANIEATDLFHRPGVELIGRGRDKCIQPESLIVGDAWVLYDDGVRSPYLSIKEEFVGDFLEQARDCLSIEFFLDDIHQGEDGRWQMFLPHPDGKAYADEERGWRSECPEDFEGIPAPDYAAMARNYDAFIVNAHIIWS